MQITLIKADLSGIDPPVWRHFLVSSDCSLADLHEVLQAALDWTNECSHGFEYPPGRPPGVGPSRAPISPQDESHWPIERFSGERLVYRYDDGDGWTVNVEVGRSLDLPGFGLGPYCIEGVGAAPPEHSGGPSGYTRLVRVVDEPDNPELDELREWLGEWHPDEFNLDEINEDLAEIFN
jgi:hypothetical protein